MELYTRTDSNPDIEVTTQPYEHKGIVIPEEFVSDGASTPRIFWAIIPPFKRVKKAAFIHDYLCRNAKSVEDRRVADKIFKEMLLEVAKINPVRATIGYLGVRLGSFFGVGVCYPHWTDRIKLWRN